MDIVHVCIQYSNLQNIAKYWFHVPTNEHIPYFCQVYIPDIIYKVHTRIHCITSSQVKCFYLLVFTICLWGEQANQKHFDLGRCSIHNADIYIVYSPFGDSENKGKNSIKSDLILNLFLYKYFTMYTIYKLKQIFTDFLDSK